MFSPSSFSICRSCGREEALDRNFECQQCHQRPIEAAIAAKRDADRAALHQTHSDPDRRVAVPVERESLLDHIFGPASNLDQRMTQVGFTILIILAMAGILLWGLIPCSGAEQAADCGMW